MKNLLQALSNMHAEFGISITDDKTGAHKVSYASLVHTLESIAKMTKPHGLQLTQDYDLIEGMPAIISTLTHIETGECKVSRSILTPKKDGDPCQAWGGATTYHKRYGAMTVCGLFCHGDPTDDDGQGEPLAQNNTPHNESSTSEKSEYISIKQLRLLNGTLQRKPNPSLEADIIKHYKSAAQIPWSQFNAILARAEGKK